MIRLLRHQLHFLVVPHLDYWTRNASSRRAAAAGLLGRRARDDVRAERRQPLLQPVRVAGDAGGGLDHQQRGARALPLQRHLPLLLLRHLEHGHADLGGLLARGQRPGHALARAELGQRDDPGEQHARRRALPQLRALRQEHDRDGEPLERAGREHARRADGHRDGRPACAVVPGERKHRASPRASYHASPPAGPSSLRAHSRRPCAPRNARTDGLPLSSAGSHRPQRCRRAPTRAACSSHCLFASHSMR